MKTAKVLVVVSVLLSTLLAVSARASWDIHILSESYHVEGAASGVHLPSWEGVTFSYDLTRPVPPAYGEITHPTQYGSLFDDEGQQVFHVESLATRYVQGGNMAFHADQTTVCTTCNPGAPDNYADASLAVDFTLEGTDSRLYINAWRHVEGLGGGWAYGWAEATLTDLTAGQTWDILRGPQSGWDPDTSIALEASLSVPIDPAHTYRLEVLAFAPDGHSSEITVVFAIPAPGAILLGTLGAGFAGLLRRRSVL